MPSPYEECWPWWYKPFRLDCWQYLYHQAPLYFTAQLPLHLSLSRSLVVNAIPRCGEKESPAVPGGTGMKSLSPRISDISQISDSWRRKYKKTRNRNRNLEKKNVLPSTRSGILWNSKGQVWHTVRLRAFVSGATLNFPLPTLHLHHPSVSSPSRNLASNPHLIAIHIRCAMPSA